MFVLLLPILRNRAISRVIGRPNHIPISRLIDRLEGLLAFEEVVAC